MSSRAKLFVVVNHVFSNLGSDGEEFLGVERVECCCDAFAAATEPFGPLSIADGDHDPEVRVRKGEQIVLDGDQREEPASIGFCPWCGAGISGLEIREQEAKAA